RPPATSTLFPYTTLFRSLAMARHRLVAVDRAPSLGPAVQRCVDILSEEIRLRKGRVRRGHGERRIRRAKEEAGIFEPEKLRLARSEEHTSELQSRSDLVC